MPETSDLQDRRQAMRMFVAVAVCVILLVGMAVAAVAWLSEPFGGWVAVTFDGGIGLRQAAVIAFGVTVVTLILFTLVSGGDALLGELPFVLIGFFFFFLFFWLMTAWIF